MARLVLLLLLTAGLQALGAVAQFALLSQAEQLISRKSRLPRPHERASARTPARCAAFVVRMMAVEQPLGGAGPGPACRAP